MVTGHVKNVTDYGVFVDLGGMDGLLHVSDLVWGRVPHPSTLVKAGVKVTELNISPQVDSDSSLAVPILVAFMESHPQLKGIGTQHGGVTGFIPQALRQVGKQPGQIIVGGIDLAPSTIAGLQEKYITATLDQQLYLQGFLPVTQCVLSARYHFAGLSINTGAGVETPATIDALIPLIKRGIR